MVSMEWPIRMGSTSMLLQYSSSLEDPTFYIYLDGILVVETKQTEYLVAVNPDEELVVEILDDPDEVPMQVFPGRVQLGWFFVDETDYYRVDEYVDSEWAEQDRVPDNNGFLIWASRFLEDGQSHQFRIVPVGLDGNEGEARSFTVLMVRHPDVPDVEYSYSSITNKVTITAA